MILPTLEDRSSWRRPNCGIPRWSQWWAFILKFLVVSVRSLTVWRPVPSRVTVIERLVVITRVRLPFLVLRFMKIITFMLITSIVLVRVTAIGDGGVPAPGSRT